MAKLIVVMGTAASGKTHFIENHFSNILFKHISIGEYQRSLKTRQEVDSMSDMDYFDYLTYCNEKAKDDMVEALKSGENVILEHTLFKAKRRIVYTESARAVTNEPIEIYVMMPSKDRISENLILYPYGRELSLNKVLGDMAQIEPPNPAEGFNKIYNVTDNEIIECIISEDLDLIERAKIELKTEAEQIRKRFKEKQTGREAEKFNERQKIIKELEYRPFWHTCEVCGKKEFMTAEAAYIKGWDYPPKMGKFGVVSPRTCGDCGIEETVWWHMMKVAKGSSIDDETMPREHKERIIGSIVSEPYSLLEEQQA